MNEKNPITWNDVVRTTEPLKWKRILDKVAYTPIDLARAMNRFVKERTEVQFGSKFSSDPSKDTK